MMTETKMHHSFTLKIGQPIRVADATCTCGNAMGFRADLPYDAESFTFACSEFKQKPEDNIVLGADGPKAASWGDLKVRELPATSGGELRLEGGKRVMIGHVHSVKIDLRTAPVAAGDVVYYSGDMVSGKPAPTSGDLRIRSDAPWAAPGTVKLNTDDSQFCTELPVRCAFCGDAFSGDPRNDTPMIWQDKRMHHNCAMQAVRRYEAECAKSLRGLPDPYATHQAKEAIALAKRGIQVNRAFPGPYEDELGQLAVQRWGSRGFTADGAPPRREREVKHPWENGFTSPSWED